MLVRQTLTQIKKNLQHADWSNKNIYCSQLVFVMVRVTIPDHAKNRMLLLYNIFNLHRRRSHCLSNRLEKVTNTPNTAPNIVKLPFLLVLVMLVSSCATSDKDLQDVGRTAGVLLGGNAAELTANEISNGLKEALLRSSQLVVSQVGKTDGFAADPSIRVPLPRGLARARNYAKRVNLESHFDDLELKLNRAAERAAPKAQSLFYRAIKQMTLDDAKGILRGPDDAATRYFERTTSDRLRQAMSPLIDESLAEVGAVNTFNDLLAAYRRIPLAPAVEADLTEHVLDEGMEGLFYYIAKEEKAIRENPVKRTTSLLQRVFGSQR